MIANTRSSAEPFLTYASRRDLREKVFQMWTRRGEMDEAHNNKPTITAILKLRAERAKLLGYPTHAHWILDDNMAKTPEQAMNLMLEVWQAAVKRVHKDVADMQQIADQEGATFTLEAWDYRYYAEKLRKKDYDLDSNEVMVSPAREDARRHVLGGGPGVWLAIHEARRPAGHATRHHGL